MRARNPFGRSRMTHQFLSRIAEVIFDQIEADRGVFRAFDAKGEPVFEAAMGTVEAPGRAASGTFRRTRSSPTSRSAGTGRVPGASSPIPGPWAAVRRASSYSPGTVA